MFLQEAAGLRKEPRGKLVGVMSQAIGVRRSGIIFLTNACWQYNISEMLLPELNEKH